LKQLNEFFSLQRVCVIDGESDFCPTLGIFERELKKLRTGTGVFMLLGTLVCVHGFLPSVRLGSVNNARSVELASIIAFAFPMK
jgi:hypothetical protein